MSTQTLPSAVLFVCSMNMVRSPMAASLTRHLSENKIFVRSAGIEKGTEDPRVARVLSEIEVEATSSEPKALSDLGDSFFDLVVVLSEPALSTIEQWAADKACEVEFWPTDDPTLATGNANQVLDAYRLVRDSLRSKIEDRFSTKSS